MIPDGELATYETLSQIIDQEDYHNFLAESVNSRAIGDEFEVQYYKSKNKYYDEQTPYWHLAAYEDYVEIEPVYIDKIKIKILKHFERPIYEIYFN